MFGYQFFFQIRPGHTITTWLLLLSQPQLTETENA